MIPDPIRQGSTYKISYISKMPFRSFLKEDKASDVVHIKKSSLIIALYCHLSFPNLLILVVILESWQ